MKLSELKIGMVVYIYDMDETKKWYKHEVIDITNRKALVMDIDERSDWQGLQVDLTQEDINDKKYFKIR